MSIPPIIIGGQPTCPDGYALSPDQTQCIPISPPIRVDVTGVASQEIDPANSARLSARGIRDSGLIERFVTALATTAITLGKDIITGISSFFDWSIAFVANLALSAQGQGTSGFYALSAALMTDLLGIEVDGDALYSKFVNGGRVEAMNYLGGTIFQALAAEFAGVHQRGKGNAFTFPIGSGMGGLPAVMPKPGDGIKAAETFLGFATSFAVREGNTDAFAEICENPIWNPVRALKDFGEDFSKSLGIGRLLRVAIRPLMQIMVAEPLTHDLNTQYRPTFLKPAEAVRAWASGFITLAEFQTEMAAAGYSDSRINALSWQHEKMPSVQELETLRAGRAIDPQDEKVWFHRLGYTDEVIALLQKARDLEPARKLSLRYLEHYLEQYLQGHLTQASVNSFLDAMAASNRVLVTPGELEAVRALVALTATATLRPRHLSLAQLQLGYIDGTITLQELEQHLTDIGYSADDVTTLGIETLIKARDKAATAAAKAAKKKTGTPKPGSAASPTPTPGA